MSLLGSIWFDLGVGAAVLRYALPPLAKPLARLVFGTSYRDVRAIPPKVRAAVIARDGYVCRYCTGPAPHPHLDHVIPWSRGGATSARNLVVSCGPCNLSKGARTPAEWRAAA